MIMIYYDILTHIFREEGHLQARDKIKLVLHEPASEFYPAQTVEVDTNIRNLQYSIYRFDVEKDGLFPFFKKLSSKDKGKSYNGLLQSCDYIMLCAKNEQTHVLLLELKRGGAQDAQIQLEASRMFIEFVKNTAKRISRIKGNDLPLQEQDIKYHKIVIAESASDKQTTMPDEQCIKSGDVVTICLSKGESLRLRMFLI